MTTSVFGVTEKGFVRKRLPDCIAEREQAYRAEFGNDIRTDPESRFGQLIGIEAKNEADIWEQMENIYYSQYPKSAAGASLDNSIQYNGLTRLPSTHTEIYVGVSGNNPDIGKLQVTRNLQIRSTSDNLFTCAYDLTLANKSVSMMTATFKIKTASDSTVYFLKIDSLTISITTSSSGTTVESIISALYIACQAVLPSYITLTKGADYLRLVSNGLDFLVVDYSDKIRIFHDILFTANDYGPVPATFGSLTIIETPVYGVEQVYNFTEGVVGRNEESDEELRVRRDASMRSTGGGTVEAMRTRVLQEVDNVRNALVIDNPYDSTDVDGRPPHSVEFIVVGGDEQKIADKISEVRGAGIQTVGTHSYMSTDSQGIQHVIKFNRPTEKEVYIYALIHRDATNTFPTNGVETIVENLVAYGETLQIGQDIITQRLLVEFYKVAGISSVVVHTRFSDTNFSANNLTIAPSEYGTIENVGNRIIIDVQ